jgi:hypothetical protein
MVAPAKDGAQSKTAMPADGTVSAQYACEEFGTSRFLRAAYASLRDKTCSWKAELVRGTEPV